MHQRLSFPCRLRHKATPRSPAMATVSFLGLPTAAPGQGAPHSQSSSTGWRLDPASPPALLTTGRKSCCVGGDGICREPQPSCTSIGYSQVCLPGVPVFWNILCSEPCKQQIPDCHGHRGSGRTFRAALLLFHPIPGATVQRGRSIVPHSAIITPSAPCCSAMKPSLELFPRDTASLMRQKQVNCSLETGKEKQVPPQRQSLAKLSFSCPLLTWEPQHRCQNQHATAGFVLERGVQPPLLSKLNCSEPATAAIRPDRAFPGMCSALGTFQHSSYYPRKLGFHHPNTAVFGNNHHEGLLRAPQPSFPFPTRGLGKHRLPPHVTWGSSCSPCSSSYPSMLKLCRNKLLNGKECLQLSLQSAIKFPKSFYTTVSLE